MSSVPPDPWGMAARNSSAVSGEGTWQDYLAALAATYVSPATTSGRIRLLGDYPVMTTPLTITLGTSSGALSGAVPTVPGTLYKPEWEASTFYPAGAQVLHPTDQKTVIRRIAAGTSGSTYDSTAWTALPDGALVTYPVRYECVFLRQRQLNASNTYGPRPPKQVDGSEETANQFESIWAVEFDWYTVAGAFEVAVYDKTELRFVVDGQYVSLTPTQLTGGNNYAWQYIKVAGATAGYHRVRIEVGGPWSAIGGIQVATADYVYPTSQTATKSLMVVGDSISNGYTGPAAGSAAPDLRGYSALAARILGFGTFLNLSVAATGFTTASNVNYSARLQDVINAQPDYLYIAGTSNDISNASTTLSSAAQSFYSSVKSGCPNTKIIAAGAINIAGATDTVTPVLRTAATAAGVPFLDTSDWDAIRQAGMSVDGTHPTVVGHEYLARRLASALSAAWNLPL